MKKKILAVIFFTVLTSGLFAENMDSLLDTLVKDFETGMDTRKVLGIGTFVYADKQLGSSFSHFLAEKVGMAFGKSRLFELAPRDKLDEILEEIRFGMSGLVDDSSAVEPGMLKGLQLLLHGKFFESRTGVRVFIKLLDIETGIQIEEEEINFNLRDIPAEISIRPDNYSDALYVIDELSGIMNSADGALAVKTWTRRGNGGTYKDGEQLVINFFSTKDCFIKIYHIDVNGNMQLIFPNPFFTNNFLKGNKIYKIPDSSYPFTFDLGAPFGTEFIKVLASTVQFSGIEESFEIIGKASANSVTRGLNIGRKETQTTEALISYTIIEAAR